MARGALGTVAQRGLGQMRLPFGKRRPAGDCQRVDATFEAHEPAVNIPLQDSGCIWRRYFEVARPRWRLGKGHRTRERVLPICSHDRLPGAAAGRRIADASSMFIDDF